MVIKLVAKHGCKSWAKIAENIGGRLGKQCRERWYNHLNPDIKTGPWETEEDNLILFWHNKIGNKWAEISKHIPGKFKLR